MASNLLNEQNENVADGSFSSQTRWSAAENVGTRDTECFSSSFAMTAKESIKATLRHFITKCFRCLWRYPRYLLKGFQKLWVGNLKVPLSYSCKCILYEAALLVQSGAGIQLHFYLPKLLHILQLDNISNSSGNTLWGVSQQLVIMNRLVGCDTILVNSLLNSPGQGVYARDQGQDYAQHPQHENAGTQNDPQ
uniref:Uncharacterized protein n=1 Tax=Kalanchoe fedtschenkoi TaxID=63787 RepID=A0A7N0TWR1_KALFE